MLIDEQIKIILDSWGSTLPRKNVIYISGPMTTGVSTVFQDSLLPKETFESNCQKIHDLADRMRIEYKGVIDPSGLEMPCWGQEEYMRFWLRCIEERVSKIYFVDGWQYSSGCLREMQKAIELKIPMFDARGRDLSLSALMGIVETAHNHMSDNQKLTKKGEMVFEQLEMARERLVSFFR